MNNLSKYLKHFKAAFILALAGILLGAILGYWLTGTVNGALSAALTTLILGVLETTLSLDNSIIDAGILREMEPKWQKRYISWGMPVSVFGMRMLFPVFIVSVIAGISPWATLIMAINSPKEYSEILTNSHALIAAFGGSFLLLIGFNYFFDSNKETHWIKSFEKPLGRMGNIKGISVALTLLILVCTSRFLEPSHTSSFLISGILGIISYVLVKDGLGAIVSHNNPHAEQATIAVAKGGMASFIYLEFIDASMSFDGVIGAFAITTNIFTIAIGLGIGAMFVRCLTMLMIKENIAGKLEFLENGAYFAILSLAFIMFTDLIVQVPDIITGLIGLVFILLAGLSSLPKTRKKNAADQKVGRDDKD